MRGENYSFIAPCLSWGGGIAPYCCPTLSSSLIAILSSSLIAILSSSKPARASARPCLGGEVETQGRGRTYCRAPRARPHSRETNRSGTVKLNRRQVLSRRPQDSHTTASLSQCFDHTHGLHCTGLKFTNFPQSRKPENETKKGPENVRSKPLRFSAFFVTLRTLWASFWTICEPPAPRKEKDHAPRLF